MGGRPKYIHKEESSLRGQTLKIIRGAFKGKEFFVRDWWDRVGGHSWIMPKGSEVCLAYGKRVNDENLPIDNEVLFGKIGHLWLLIHLSELETQEQLL
jgi:hypothetical protein